MFADGLVIVRVTARSVLMVGNPIATLITGLGIVVGRRRRARQAARARERIAPETTAVEFARDVKKAELVPLDSIVRAELVANRRTALVIYVPSVKNPGGLMNYTCECTVDPKWLHQTLGPLLGDRLVSGQRCRRWLGRLPARRHAGVAPRPSEHTVRYSHVGHCQPDGRGGKSASRQARTISSVVALSWRAVRSRKGLSAVTRDTSAVCR